MSEKTVAPGYWQGWCDGSALPNPGRMGIGGVLCAPDQSVQEFSKALGPSGCNNEAEASALLELLQLACRCGARCLVVWSDSDVVVRIASAAQSDEAQRLAPLFARIREAMLLFEVVELRWLPQHRNEIADRLSRQALGLKPRVIGAVKCKRHKR